jgi:hypothetical protein
MRHSKKVLFLCLVLVLSAPLRAVETAVWQVGAFDEFLQGTLSGVSLSKEGELELAPEARTIFTPEEALALSLASGPNRTVYVGTGHQGKVFRVDSNRKAALFFTAREPNVFALAVGPDGALYAGSSPDGKIYRITQDGKSSVFYEPNAKYIWALAFDAEGHLYAGTGDRGQILRIDAAGKGEVFFDSKQTHIMCLTLDRQGNLLAGSFPNGLIYRLTPRGKAFVLYQAGLPEIHELAVDQRGNIYAAALGGAGGKGTPEIFLAPASGGPQPAGVTTVTVTASENEGAARPNAQTPSGEPAPAPSFNRPSPPLAGVPMPMTLQGRGTLIRILPDSTAEAVWSSNNESIFGLALRDNQVLFSTDSNGRVFELDASQDGQKLTLVTETHESLATRLLIQGSELYVATSSAARLFDVGTNPTREGSYESAVKDAKFISHWGVLAWRGEVPDGGALELFTRSGNSERPDPTWSDWAGPYRDPNGSSVLSPAARYIQWKAVFRGPGTSTPALNEVTVAYLNQNLAPQIRSLNISTSGERTGLTGGSSTGNISAVGGVTGASTGQTNFGSSSFGPTAKTPVVLSWQADDPNGDQLIYSIYVRAADEQEWHLLKDKLRQASYVIEPTALPDGKYLARLVASDELSNPPEQARKAELVSAPFWIDNTPPEIRVLKQTVSVGAAEVRFRAEDHTSPLRSAEAAIDGEDWRQIYSDEGIVDARVETFTIKASKLEPGEHIIALRAYDTAGNAGIGKAIVRVSAGTGRALGPKAKESPTGP